MFLLEMRLYRIKRRVHGALARSLCSRKRAMCTHGEPTSALSRFWKTGAPEQRSQMMSQELRNVPEVNLEGELPNEVE